MSFHYGAVTYSAEDKQFMNRQQIVMPSAERKVV